MATPEGKLTKRVVDYLDTLQNVWYLKIHGGPIQRQGVPDLMVVIRGVPWFPELKVDGNDPSALQVHTMKKIEAAGGMCHVVRSLDSVKSIVKWIAAETRGRSDREIDDSKRRIEALI